MEEKTQLEEALEIEAKALARALEAEVKAAAYEAVLTPLAKAWYDRVEANGRVSVPGVTPNHIHAAAEVVMQHKGALAALMAKIEMLEGFVRLAANDEIPLESIGKAARDVFAAYNVNLNCVKVKEVGRMVV